MGTLSKRERKNRRISESMQKFNDDTVKKLEEAFSWDCSIEEACLHAGISKQTYYNNVKGKQKLLDRFAELRENPVLKARMTVVQKVTESYPNAMDYLKRKKKLEFGDNIDVNTNGKLTLSFDSAFTNDTLPKTKTDSPEQSKI